MGHHRKVLVALSFSLSFFLSSCSKKEPEDLTIKPVKPAEVVVKKPAVPGTSQEKPEEVKKPETAVQEPEKPEVKEPVAKSAPEVPEEVFAEFDHRGSFQAVNGAAVELYYEKESETWAMDVKEPEASPYTLYLGGDSSELTPVGLKTDLPFGGEKLKIVAHGKKLYGRVQKDGRSYEVSLEPGKGFQSAVNGDAGKRTGKDISSDEIALRMTVDEFANTWGWMKKSQFHYNDGTLKVSSPLRGRQTVRPEPVAFTGKVVPDEFPKTRRMEMLLNKPWDRGMGSFARKANGAE